MKNRVDCHRIVNSFVPDPLDMFKVIYSEYIYKHLTVFIFLSYVRPLMPAKWNVLKFLKTPYVPEAQVT